MALTPEQIDAEAFARWGDMKGAPLAMCRGFARAIEAEVCKDHDALIRQMLAFAELVKRGLENGSVKAQPIIEIDDDAPDLVIKTLHGEAVGAITAARARLIDSDLSKLTERGAKAWAGVDPQKLREGKAL